MKSGPRFEENGRNCWKEQILKQSLAKDLKRSSYLGGNPSNFHILLVWFCLIQSV